MGRFILNKKHFGARIVFARLVQGIFLYDFAFSISNNGHISLGNFDKFNFFIYPVKDRSAIFLCSLRRVSSDNPFHCLSCCMDFQICSTASIRNPPLPQAGSQTVCLGIGSTTRTAILTTSRGVKNSPFSPTSLLSAKTSKASPMTSLFDFNKLYLSN